MNRNTKERNNIFKQLAYDFYRAGEHKTREIDVILSNTNDLAYCSKEVKDNINRLFVLAKVLRETYNWRETVRKALEGK